MTQRQRRDCQGRARADLVYSGLQTRLFLGMKSALTPWFCLTLIVAFAALSRAAEKPNVVFILVDDLGWTDLSSYGSDLYETPQVDRLAQQGMRFTSAYAACTVCSPTRASIMTGKYPATLRITDWITGHLKPHGKLAIPDWTQFLAPEAYTLGDALHDAGYRTAHLGKWHLGETAEYWPENQGFEINLGGWKVGQPQRGETARGYFSPYGNPRLQDGPDGEYLTERLADEAVRFIERNKDQPFFLNLWFYNVHTPLQAAADKVAKYEAKVFPDARHQNATYAAMVEHMDDAVGKVMVTLDRLGLADNTIVVFTSDNGGLIGNRGGIYQDNVTLNAPLRSGKGDAYEGGVRVPLIVRYPGRIAPNTRSSELAISPDFFPTLMTLAGVTPATAVEFDGADLSPVLTGQAAVTGREAVYFHYPHYHTEGATPYSAIRKGQWKLIEFYEGNRVELYYLSRDPGESINLADTEPAKRDELFADLQAWKIRTDAQLPSLNPDFSPEGEDTFRIGAPIR